ncbi:lectin-like [Salvia miltiorrhiza]|uniref:lectin-like n=1 Tax=Salvia miltiorrhiza TaxID=226208 RepID=UPI0025ACE147|nr:lectin-like [Salvia miltiorrhiza]
MSISCENNKYPTAHGGNLGIFEPPTQSPGPRVFAVAFDIYSQNPGYIKLGICIRSRTPKSFIKVPDSFLGTNLKLKVSYDSANKYISASVSNGNMTFPESFPYDLSDFLPPKVEVGLASSTGQYVAVHDVFSWGFKKGTAAQAIALYE